MQTEVNLGETLKSSTQPAAHDHNRISEALGSQPTVRTIVVDSNHATTPADQGDSSLQLAEDLRKFQKLAAEIRSTLQPAEGFEARCQQMFTLSNDLFSHAPTWVCFFREALSSEGICRTIFASQEDYDRFLNCPTYRQIEQMLTALRSRDLPENDPNDPQRMITVRLPKSLHETLCHEAGRLKISVNKLCISRLLQLLDHTMIPETASKPRGRKPRTHIKAEAAQAPTSVTPS